MRLLLFFAVVLLFPHCSKTREETLPVVPEIEFRVVNQGDTNLTRVLIQGGIYRLDGQAKSIQEAVFSNIKPLDTIVFKMGFPGNGTVNYLHWRRSLGLHFGFKNKVFSPKMYAVHFIEEGAPYAIGWTYSRQYLQTPFQDTINSPSDKVLYYYWPADSAKIKEWY